MGAETVMPPEPIDLELGPPDLELSSQLCGSLRYALVTHKMWGSQIPVVCVFFFFLAFLQGISRAHYIDMEFRAEYGDNSDILNLRI